MRFVLVAVALAACVEVADEHRCASDEDCVLDGAQGRCEPTRYCSFADATCGNQGFRYHEHTAAPGVCILPPVPASPAPIDLADFSDRVATPCAASGARDVQFEFSTPIPQTVFFDNIDASVVFALHAGGCPATTAPLGCVPAGQPCGAIPYARLAVDLPPGTYCLVVEEVAASATTVSLRSLPAGRIATGISAGGSVTGDTCMDPRSASTTPSCAPVSGPETTFLVALCPQQQLQGVALDPTPFDAVLTLGQSVPQDEVRCSNTSGASGPEAIGQLPLAAPGPYWIVVDGVGASCGPFTLSVAF